MLTLCILLCKRKVDIIYQCYLDSIVELSYIPILSLRPQFHLTFQIKLKVLQKCLHSIYDSHHLHCILARIFISATLLANIS